MTSTESFRLDGKVALVTGGTGVICSPMCRALGAAGAKVVVLALEDDKVALLAQEIKQDGGDAIGIKSDVLDKLALEAAAEQVAATYGRIDILVNGAGGNRPDATTIPGERSFFDIPQEALRWVFDLNFTGAMLASQVFGKFMVEQGSGAIVNISSMAAYSPMTRVVAYAAAKAAISNFTQWLAVYMATEHSPDIRVNAIAPGFFLGEQNRYLLVNEQTGNWTARGQQIIDHTPQGRFGEPDDLLGTLLWLVSDAARFVTGVVVPVDGGFMAYSGV